MIWRKRWQRPYFWVFLCVTLLFTLPLQFALSPSAFASPAVGNQAVVITTEGDQLIVRAAAGREAPIIGSLAQGTVVQVVGGPTSADGITWLKIKSGALIGWASAEWLGDPSISPATLPSAPAAPAPTAPAPAPAAPAPKPDTGSTLDNGNGATYVTGTDGRGARLRAEPSLTAAILLLVPEGGAVTLLGATRTAEGYEWSPVRYSGADGWIASSLLGANATPAVPTANPVPTPAAAPAPAPTPAPVAAPAAGGVVVGGAAQVVNTDGYQLRIRQQPGLDAPIVSFAPAGAIVQVTGGPQNDNTGAPWYGIDYAGVSGWVLGEHLAPATASTITPATSPQPATKPAPTAAPVATPKPTAQPIVAPAPASGQGQAVVAVALKYLGVPYVYGGTTPSGWDCSGFVGYVYKEAAGITLPRSAAQQYRAGTAVPVGQEQAGDIVFFADTFGPGITHDGIALGDGRFVHARSEGYGTVISSLSDPYWSQHYAGARRP